MAAPSRDEFETLQLRVEGVARRLHDLADKVPNLIESQVTVFVRAEVADRLKGINGQYVTWDMLKLIVGALVTLGVLEAGIVIWLLRGR